MVLFVFTVGLLNLGLGFAVAVALTEPPPWNQLKTKWLGKLPNLAKVPILILVAEASYHAAYDHVTAAYLTQAGVRNDFVRLPDIGIRGNGHMMMLEKNSDEIAGVIEKWLKKTLASKPKAKRRKRR